MRFYYEVEIELRLVLCHKLCRHPNKIRDRLNIARNWQEKAHLFRSYSTEIPDAAFDSDPEFKPPALPCFHDAARSILGDTARMKENNSRDPLTKHVVSCALRMYSMKITLDKVAAHFVAHNHYVSVVLYVQNALSKTHKIEPTKERSAFAGVLGLLDKFILVS